MNCIKISLGDTVNIDKCYIALVITDPIISKGDNVTVNGRIIRAHSSNVTNSGCADKNPYP